MSELICGNCGGKIDVGCICARALSGGVPEWELDCPKCGISVLLEANSEAEAIAAFKLATRADEVERLETIILSAPGADEDDFEKIYRKWWDVNYRPLRMKQGRD